jgi:hypothetical protein
MSKLDNLPIVTKLNDLPVIIDEPGEYVTRDGRRAVIDCFGNGTFSAKGTLFTKRTVRTVKHYEIWHPSGRCVAVGESKRDIVAKAEKS